MEQEANMPLLLGQFTVPDSVCPQWGVVLFRPCQLWNLTAIWTSDSCLFLHELFPSWCFGIFHMPSTQLASLKPSAVTPSTGPASFSYVVFNVFAFLSFYIWFSPNSNSGTVPII